MNCPVCGLYGFVPSGSKPRRADGITYRLRRCRHGHEFWTQETVVMAKSSEPALTTDDMVTLLRNERG